MNEVIISSRPVTAFGAKPMRIGFRIMLVVAALLVVGLLAWQGITAQGSPDPTIPHLSPMVARLDIGVLVFREGLECILVLSAITASMVGTNRFHRRPVAFGAVIGLLATVF